MNTNNNTHYDCIVIGAGISGVSLAAQLKQLGQSVLLLDKNDRIGGQIHSQVSPTVNDFWLEMGAHTCYNSYTRLLKLAVSYGIEDHIIPLGKGGYVAYSKGKIRSLVSQVAYIPMALHFFNFFRSKRDGKTVREYFSPIVGKVNYDRLFSKAFRAVICQVADEYPAELFLKRREGRNEAFPRKYTFKQGISILLAELIRRSGATMRLSQEVTSIEVLDPIVARPNGSGYRLNTRSGQSFTANRIALATDPGTAATLLTSLEPEVSSLLREIPMSTLSTIGVVVDKKASPLKTIAGIIPVSDAFMSVVSRDLLPHETHRAFAFHFMEPQATFEDKKELITSVLGVSEEDIIESHTLKHYLPALRLSSVGMAERLEQVRRHTDIHMVGNYFYGLSLEDCVNRADDVLLKLKVES